MDNSILLVKSKGWEGVFIEKTTQHEIITQIAVKRNGLGFNGINIVIRSLESS